MEYISPTTGGVKMTFFKSYLMGLLPYIIVFIAIIFELVFDFGWINIYYVLLFALVYFAIMSFGKIRRIRNQKE